MAGVVLKAGFPRSRRYLMITRNAVRLVLGGALRSWRRNLGGTAPALGSMALLLVLTGVVGLSGLAARNLAAVQSREASILHVYLRDDAKPEATSALQARLREDPRVRTVVYVSKEEALARAEHRPGLPELVAGTDSNPFPASFDVRLNRVQDVGAIDASVRHDEAVDPIIPTSYDRGAYQRIQQFLLVGALIGAGFLAVLAFVAVTVTANAVRSAIMARRDEVQIMQLVGAPRWMIRAPFLVEGAITGSVAGVLAGAAVVAAAIAAIRGGAGGFTQIAPGVDVGVAVGAGLAVFAAGLMIGSASSFFGVRKYLEV